MAIDSVVDDENVLSIIKILYSAIKYIINLYNTIINNNNSNDDNNDDGNSNNSLCYIVDSFSSLLQKKIFIHFNDEYCEFFFNVFSIDEISLKKIIYPDFFSLTTDLIVNKNTIDLTRASMVQEGAKFYLLDSLNEIVFYSNFPVSNLKKNNYYYNNNYNVDKNNNNFDEKQYFENDSENNVLNVLMFFMNDNNSLFQNKKKIIENNNINNINHNNNLQYNSDIFENKENKNFEYNNELFKNFKNNKIQINNNSIKNNLNNNIDIDNFDNHINNNHNNNSCENLTIISNQQKDSDKKIKQNYTEEQVLNSFFQTLQKNFILNSLQKKLQSRSNIVPKIKLADAGTSSSINLTRYLIDDDDNNEFNFEDFLKFIKKIIFNGLIKS
jgi:hypothetical protein